MSQVFLLRRVPISEAFMEHNLQYRDLDRRAYSTNTVSPCIGHADTVEPTWAQGSVHIDQLQNLRSRICAPPRLDSCSAADPRWTRWVVASQRRRGSDRWSV